MNFYIQNFLVSMIPLWTSIIIILVYKYFCNLKFYSNDILAINIIIIFVIVISIILINSLLIFFIRKIKKYENKKSDSEKCKIINIVKYRTLSLEYIFAYVMPLVAFKDLKFVDVINLILYIFIIVFLIYKNNYFVGNVILEIFGYKFYKCQFEDINNGEEVILMTKNDMFGKNNMNINVAKVNNDFWIEVVDRG